MFGNVFKICSANILSLCLRPTGVRTMSIGADASVRHTPTRALSRIYFLVPIFNISNTVSEGLPNSMAVRQQHATNSRYRSLK